MKVLQIIVCSLLCVTSFGADTVVLNFSAKPLKSEWKGRIDNGDIIRTYEHILLANHGPEHNDDLTSFKEDGYYSFRYRIVVYDSEYTHSIAVEKWVTKDEDHNHWHLSKDAPIPSAMLRLNNNYDRIYIKSVDWEAPDKFVITSRDGTRYQYEIKE